MMNIHPKAGDQGSKPLLTSIIKSREMVQFAPSNITRKIPENIPNSKSHPPTSGKKNKSHPQIIFQVTSPIKKWLPGANNNYWYY